MAWTRGLSDVYNVNQEKYTENVKEWVLLKIFKTELQSNSGFSELGIILGHQFPDINSTIILLDTYSTRQKYSTFHDAC